MMWAFKNKNTVIIFGIISVEFSMMEKCNKGLISIIDFLKG